MLRGPLIAGRAFYGRGAENAEILREKTAQTLDKSGKNRVK